MENNTPNSKLDEIIKQTLSNYEVPYNADDWAKMESILDASPNSRSFKYKHLLLSRLQSLQASLKPDSFNWKLSLYILIGLLVLLSGGYLLYNISKPSATPENITVTPPPQITEPTTNVIPTPTIEPVSSVTTASSSSITATPDIVPVVNNVREIKLAVKDKVVKIEQTDTDTTENKININQPILKIENEPAVVTTRDSSRSTNIVPKDSSLTKEEVKKDKRNRRKRSSYVSPNDTIKNNN